MEKRLNYIKFKSTKKCAPKILILHGLMGSLRNWSIVGKLLSEKFEVHLLDLRNHGESPWFESMSWDDLVEDLINYLEISFINSPLHVIGHSYGGKIAMRFASAYPHKVRKLVVIDIIPKKYPPHYKKEFEALIELNLENYKNRHEVSDALINEIPNENFRESLLTNLKRTKDGFSWKPNLRVLHKNLDLIRSNPLSCNIKYNGDTLLIIGETSDFVQKEDLSSMSNYFPKASSIMMKGVGHNPHVERRTELVRILNEWL